MRPPEKIKDLLKEPRIFVSSEKNNKILNAALMVYERTQKEKLARSEPNIWRIIMRSRLTKFTATVVIIIAILFGINQFNGSPDGASVLYAQVRKSIEKKPWICTKQTVKGEKLFSGEEWFSLESKIMVEIVGDGRITYYDYNHNRKYEYKAMSGIITISPIKESSLFLETRTYLELFEKLIEMKKKMGAEFKRTLVEQDGKTLEIWEVTRTDDTGSEKLKLFINIKEYLPINAEITYTDTAGKVIDQGTIEFEYPENGPKNIYELGVPKDAKVIYLEAPGPEVTNVAAEYDKRRGQLGDFRALTIYTSANNKSKFTIFEYLPSKDKHRHSNSREIADYHSKSLDELVETLVSDNWLTLLDTKSKVFPTGYLPNNIILLEPKMFNVFTDYYVGEWKILTSEEPKLLNNLGFELKTYPRNGIYVRTWWFDPENDYWVSRFTSEMLEDNVTPKTKLQVTAFNKTIGGHSYPSKIIEQITGGNRVVRAHFDIYMEEAVYSPNVDKAFIRRALKAMTQQE